MWLWQRNAFRRNRFWLRLVGVSCAAHVVVLFCVLFVYRGYLGSHTIDSAKNIHADAKIVVLPLYKTVPAQVHADIHKRQTLKAAIAIPVQPQKAAAPPPSVYPGHQARQPSEGKPAPKKIVAPVKKERAPTTLRSQLPAKKQRVKKKPEQKQHQKKNKKELQPVAPKPEIKKIEPVIPEPKVPDVSPTLQQPATSSAAVPLETALDANAVYVGTTEADALLMQQEIKAEVERCWRPPTGLAPELMCHITVRVGWDGVIAHMDIIKKSGVLMYDISAREAVAAMTFPKITWGKDLTIIFNQ